MVRIGRGEWKGHSLRPVSWCRPTKSVVASAVMDIAGAGRVRGGLFWDLCCGTGSVGLEALSWGASGCLFVDRGRGSLRELESFLDERGALGRAQLLRADLRVMSVEDLPGEPDVVYIDPPYAAGTLYEWILEQDWACAVATGGMVLVESGPETELPGWIHRTYGESVLHILEPERPGRMEEST